MPLVCRWTHEALTNLWQIRLYIAEDNPQAAKEVFNRIMDLVEAQVAEYPQVGRAGRIHGTRELVISGLPYIAVYRVRSNQVEILNVIHTSQQWPDQV